MVKKLKLQKNGAGITVHPDERWRQQVARNVTMEGCGTLRDGRYLLHDRDTKYTQSFRAIIASGRVEPIALPARSPNLNAYAERWVRSVKEECLSKVILFGERSLRRALGEYLEHYHSECIIRGRTTSCCFLAIQTSPPRGLCNAASDWVGSCAITIKRRRDRTPNSVRFNPNSPRQSGDRGSRGTPCAIRCPNSGAPVSLRRSMDCRFFCRSNFLTTRGSV